MQAINLLFVHVTDRIQASRLVDEAERLARALLADDRERLRHSEGVARRAEQLAVTVPREQVPTLVASAWLHDVGYCDELHQTGFHPLDGALRLREDGWPARVCGLVAHHSGSRFVADVRGLGAELADFVDEDDEVSDALTVADQTCGPGGALMTLRQRLDDMLHRHGPSSPNARAHLRREPYLAGAARRVADRLQRAGVAAAQLRIL